MTAHVFGLGDWVAARERRAQRGKAPRLAVRRCIMLRQQGNGDWYVGIYTWRRGRWLKPEWVCPPASLARACNAARATWQQLRLPAVWQYSGDRGLRPLRFGQSEPVESAA